MTECTDGIGHVMVLFQMTKTPPAARGGWEVSWILCLVLRSAVGAPRLGAGTLVAGPGRLRGCASAKFR